MLGYIYICIYRDGDLACEQALCGFWGFGLIGCLEVCGAQGLEVGFNAGGFLGAGFKV